MSTKIDLSQVSSNYLIEETNFNQPDQQYDFKYFGFKSQAERDYFNKEFSLYCKDPVLYEKMNPVPEADPYKYYFCTFTRDTTIPLNLWWKQLIKALSLKSFAFCGAAIEHLTTNIHCHALLRTPSSHGMGSHRFKCFKSRIDIKKVIRDNGISSYISKENPSFDDLEEFVNFYQNKILSL